jgi:hydrogenase maturation protease
VRLLVAGIGNIFFGDDGFGPAVARALAADPPSGATVEDYGIRGLHLAFELVSGYDRALLIDAVPREGTPGTLYVIEPQPGASGTAPDAHRMDLENVFAFVRLAGGEAPPITLIGCEPATVDEGIGLSDAVARAVPEAAQLVRRLIGEIQSTATHDSRRSERWSEV